MDFHKDPFFERMMHARCYIAGFPENDTKISGFRNQNISTLKNEAQQASSRRNVIELRANAEATKLLSRFCLTCPAWFLG